MSTYACIQVSASMAALVWSSFDGAARCPSLVGVCLGAVSGLVAAAPAGANLNCFGALTTGFLAGFSAWCAAAPVYVLQLGTLSCKYYRPVGTICWMYDTTPPASTRGVLPPLFPLSSLQLDAVSDYSWCRTKRCVLSLWTLSKHRVSLQHVVSV